MSVLIGTGFLAYFAVLLTQAIKTYRTTEDFSGEACETSCVNGVEGR